MEASKITCKNNDSDSFEYIAILIENEQPEYYCSECIENLPDKSIYCEITKVKDLEKQKLEQKIIKLQGEIKKEYLAVNNTLKKKFEEINQITEKINEYIKTLTETQEIYNKSIIDGSNNFHILKNFENLDIRLEEYLKLLHDIDNNNSSIGMVTKQYVSDNYNEIKKHFREKLKPEYIQYKKTETFDFFDEEGTTNIIRNTLKNLITDKMRGTEIYIKGNYSPCKEIMKLAVHVIRPDIATIKETVYTSYKLPNAEIPISINSTESFNRINNRAKEIISASMNDYIGYISTSSHGFIVPQLMDMTNEDLNITVALKRIFSNYFVKIRPNSIIHGNATGKADLLMSNGSIRTFYLNQNNCIEDSSTNLYCENYPINTFIRVSVSLYSFSGNTFETDVYLFKHNYSILFGTRLSTIFTSNNRTISCEIIVNSNLKSIFDYVRGTITEFAFMNRGKAINSKLSEISKGILLNENSKSKNFVNDSIVKTKLDNNKLGLKEKQESHKPIFQAVLEQIFGKGYIASVSNINKGRVEGLFIKVNNDKSFEFTSYKNKSAYEVNCSIKLAGKIIYQNFYFTSLGYNLLKPYEICYFLPDNKDQDKDKYELTNFSDDLNTLLDKFISDEKVREKFDKSPYDKIYKNLQSYLLDEVKIIHFSDIVRCKCKGYFENYLGKILPNIKECYKIDVEFEYNFERIVFSLLFDINDNDLIFPLYSENVGLDYYRICLIENDAQMDFSINYYRQFKYIIDNIKGKQEEHLKISSSAMIEEIELSNL
jgi:hypothetical protein